MIRLLRDFTSVLPSIDTFDHGMTFNLGSIEWCFFPSRYWTTFEGRFLPRGYAVTRPEWMRCWGN
jgi:hypothetical protein